MKRYSKTVVDGRYSEMTNDDNGEWVRYEDAKKVVEALEMAIPFLDEYDDDGEGFPLLNQALFAIKQINGE